MEDDIDGAWRDALDAPELSRLSFSLELLSAAAPLLLRGISDRRRAQAYAMSSMSSVVRAWKYGSIFAVYKHVVVVWCLFLLLFLWEIYFKTAIGCVRR
jgi:hypothetical protein